MARKTQDKEVVISHVAPARTLSSTRTKSSAKTTRKKPVRTAERATSKVKRLKESVKDADSFVDELEARIDETGEQAYLREYISLYRKLKRLVRHANKRALETGQTREVYALCTLISQQREVIADLRTMSDLSGQVQMLLEQALQPMVSQIGQTIVNSFYQQRRLLIETTKEGETQFAITKLDEITSDVSKALQLYYEQAAAKIHEVLVGLPEEPKPKRKGRTK